MNMSKSISDFTLHLQKKHLSTNTVLAYSKAVTLFLSTYNDVSFKSLNDFKQNQMLRYKPQTVNLRIQAINTYLDFIGQSDFKLTLIKIQNKSFADNVISFQDYCRLKDGLAIDNDIRWFFMLWTMGATGARISELMQIKIEDIIRGFVDIYSKGGKTRRLYFPKQLSLEIYKWGVSVGSTTGHLCQNNRGMPISARGFSLHLKKIAQKYDVDVAVVHPHSFRHMYAKKFLESYSDVSLLADLLGHENIETTRIYLRRSNTEQRHLIDNIVTW